MSKALENSNFNIHMYSSKVSGIAEDLPYVLVVDEIFTLQSWLQRSYTGPLDESKKTFNYIHSCAPGLAKRLLDIR